MKVPMRRMQNKQYERDKRRQKKLLLHYKKYRERRRQVRLRIRPYFLESRDGQKLQQDIALCPPSDFRYLSNFSDCNKFFYDLIHSKPTKHIGVWMPYIKIDCSRVEQIDFVSTCLLAAICEELKDAPLNYSVYGRLPDDKECYEFIKQSGFLNGKVDGAGRQFPIVKGVSKMTIHKGQDKLKDEQLKYFVDKVREVYSHMGITSHPAYVINVLKEICGNSVEWSNATRKRWTLSVRETNDYYEFVVLDLGRGILNSLHYKYQSIIDTLGIRKDSDILRRAFDKKYKSESMEDNRHKGLPFILGAYMENKVKGLNVASNYVLLNFDDESGNKLIKKNKKRECPGTVYRWVIDKSCI